MSHLDQDSQMSSKLAEQIANLALDTFHNLPPKFKPRIPTNDRYEWTPMSAVVLHLPPNKMASTHRPYPAHTQINSLEIVSMGTGTKSLPVSALAKCNGLILHDSHAEVLALRGFTCWTLMEMQRILASPTYESQWLELSAQESHEEGKISLSLPFRFRNGIEVSLFCTEAPCGDASMELLMSALETAGRDATPWRTADREDSVGFGGGEETIMPQGRGGFANLGALRRKPARADAEVSLSKSCTDKIMLRQFTGLLGFPADLLIESSRETFLKRLVVYEDQFNDTGYTRAFSTQGRIQSVLPRFEAAFPGEVKLFEVAQLPSTFRRFDFEKLVYSSTSTIKNKVTNLATVWIAGSKATMEDPVSEILVNGVKQGHKQFDAKDGKASVLCRRKLSLKAVKIGAMLQTKGYEIPWLGEQNLGRYSKFKKQPCRAQRIQLKQLVMEGLGGWPSGGLRDDFEIHVHLPSMPNTVMNYTF